MPYSVQLTILSHTLYIEIGLFKEFDVTSPYTIFWQLKQLALLQCPFRILHVRQVMQERQRIPDKKECLINVMQQDVQKDSEGQYQQQYMVCQYQHITHLPSPTNFYAFAWQYLHKRFKQYLQSFNHILQQQLSVLLGIFRLVLYAAFRSSGSSNWVLPSNFHLCFSNLFQVSTLFSKV